MENRIDNPGLPQADREPEARPAEAGSAEAGPAEHASGPGSEALAAPQAAPESQTMQARPASGDMPAARIAGAGEGGTMPAWQRPVTGEPRVDAALARLDELPELPVTEHRAVFEHVHRSLSEVLGELDTGVPPGAGGGEHSGTAGRSGRSGDAENRRG